MEQYVIRGGREGYERLLVLAREPGPGGSVTEPRVFEVWSRREGGPG